MDRNYNVNRKLQGKNLFITEDDSLNRVVYTMAFKLSGANLGFDRFGRDTMERLKGFNPDLIILDLMLPHGESGFDIFKKIRAEPEFQNVPIVAISASEPAVAVPKCQELGFDGFIAKPVDPDLLINQVARLIDGEKVWYMGERYGGES